MNRVQHQLLQANIVLVAAFVFCGLLANVAAWKLVAEVNARLSEDKKFSWLWWTIGKYVRLWKEHKRLCPQSHWRLYSVLSYLIAIVLMIFILLSVHAPNTPM